VQYDACVVSTAMLWPQATPSEDSEKIFDSVRKIHQGAHVQHVSATGNLQPRYPEPVSRSQGEVVQTIPRAGADTPALPLDDSHLRKPVPARYRAESLPETDHSTIDLTPLKPRYDARLLKLEKRGITSHQRQQELYAQNHIFRDSMIAKLREVGQAHLAGKMATCATEEQFRRCTNCGKRTQFWNRCELFFCPICQPRLSREKKESIEWWTREIKQPKHVVLTVRNRNDLTWNYIRFLKAALARLRRQKVFTAAKSGMWSMEVTNEGQGWHVHFHLLVEARWIDSMELARNWAKCVGQDIAIVKVKDCRQGDYLREVMKYAAKGSDISGWSGAKIAEFITAMRSNRTFGVFGDLYGKRTEWREWIESIQDYQPICECGCSVWTVCTEETADWSDAVQGLVAPRPPPLPPQVSNDQLDMALDGTRWML